MLFTGNHGGGHRFDRGARDAAHPANLDARQPAISKHALDLTLTAAQFTR